MSNPSLRRLDKDVLYVLNYNTLIYCAPSLGGMSFSKANAVSLQWAVKGQYTLYKDLLSLCRDGSYKINV